MARDKGSKTEALHFLADLGFEFIPCSFVGVCLLIVMAGVALLIYASRLGVRDV